MQHRLGTVGDAMKQHPTKMADGLLVKLCAKSAMIGLGLLGAALGGGSAAPAVAQATSYPWCTVGESVGCYYATQQQCEENVDYHGFCVTNPDYRAQTDNTRRRATPQ